MTELEQARFAAQEAQTRLTQITDSMPGLVYQYHWLGPGKGHFLYTSQGVREMVGGRGTWSAWRSPVPPSWG